MLGRSFVLWLVCLGCLASAGFSAPPASDYLRWLESRQQLWAYEMKRMEAHDEGQFREAYRQLSRQMTQVRTLADKLRAAPEADRASLERELLERVQQVEERLEWLLAEVPELAQRGGSAPSSRA